MKQTDTYMQVSFVTQVLHNYYYAVYDSVICIHEYKIRPIHVIVQVLHIHISKIQQKSVSSSKLIAMKSDIVLFGNFAKQGIKH